MTNSEAKEIIYIYSSLFTNTVSKAVKENIDGLKAGRLALKLAGCPDIAAKAIEESMMRNLTIKN